MERLAPHQVWHGVRTALTIAPVPLRIALTSDRSIERRVALDRLAAFIAQGVIEAVDPEDEPDLTLPLFPEMDMAAISNLEDTPMRHDVDTIEKSGSFGRWLLDQRHRKDAIGELAQQAARDSGFPRDGDAKAVSMRLNALGADGNTHRLLEDAELDWLSL